MSLSRIVALLALQGWLIAAAMADARVNSLICAGLFASVSPTYAANDCPDCLSKVLSEIDRADQRLLRDLARKGEAIGCNPLSVGSSRVLNVSHEASPSGVELRYALRRTSERDYQVILNLEFGRESEVNEAFQKKLKTCLPIINQRLLGPQGERMTVELYRPGLVPTPPPMVRIGVADKERATSDEFSKKPSCGTITHELLHLMGQVDVYSEPTGIYTCRKLGPDESLMHYPVEAFKRAFPAIQSCVCQTASCKRALASGFSEKRCPPGSTESPPLWHPGMLDLPRFEDFSAQLGMADRIGEIHRRGSLVDQEVYYFATDRPSPSLLKPAEFNSIVYPGCGKNLRFYFCAADAYHTDAPRARGADKDRCLIRTTPRFCKNGDWLK